MSNAPFESSDSESRESVDGTFVVPAKTADQTDETLVRPREELSSVFAAGKSDAVTVQADADQESVSQSDEPSTAPRVIAFRSARGIVPLTGIERLQSIATQLQEIDAARILPIQSVGEIHDGCVVTMPPVSGVTLDQLLNTRRPSWQEALRIISQVTDALVPVHEGGLAHGCLQASRIFLRNQQLTRIADFALCLVSDELSPTADHKLLACVAPEKRRRVAISADASDGRLRRRSFALPVGVWSVSVSC